MSNLGEILKKEKANFVSVLKKTTHGEVIISHVKDLSVNADVEVKKGEKYYVKKSGKTIEKEG